MKLARRLSVIEPSPTLAVSAKAADARMFTAALRVTGWSALAMGVTAGVGALVGSLG